MKINATKGFSFVEVLVAVGILGLVLTALLTFFVQSIGLNDASHDMTLAVSHAQYILEDIRSSSGVIIIKIDEKQWDLDTDAKFADQDLARMTNEVIRVTHDGQTPPAITVSVSWQAKSGRQQQLAFVTVDSGV